MGHLPCLPGTLSRACRSLDPSARHPSTWWQGPHASKEEADLGQGHMPLHSFAQETRAVGRRRVGDTGPRDPKGKEDKSCLHPPGYLEAHAVISLWAAPGTSDTALVETSDFKTNPRAGHTAGAQTGG